MSTRLDSIHPASTHSARGFARGRTLLLAPMLASLGALACNQPAPPGSSDSLGNAETDGDTDSGDTNTGETSGSTDPTDTDPTDTTDTTGTTDTTDTGTTDTGDTGVFDDTLYPLADGASWSYIIKNINGQVLGMDIVNTTEVEWMGEQAFLLTDNPNAQGEWTNSWIVQDGTLSTRVHKEIQSDGGLVMIVDYDPGFARVDDTWTTLDFSTELLYERVETDGDGLNPKVEPRGHVFTVLDEHDQITVPAGTFDCVKIERVRSVGTNAGETAISWYAFGIGKVREERPAESRIEELVSVSLPEGAQFP